MRSSGLSGGSPRRLFLHAGKWVLEVVRHVSLGKDLIRPTTQRLVGQRAIASYFKSNPDKATLGKATLRLIQVEALDEWRSYTAEGSDWVANSTPPRGNDSGSYGPPSRPVLEALVTELEARVVVLSAMQEGLLARLARVEAKLARGTFSEDVRGGGARAELRPGSSEALDEAAPMDAAGYEHGADAPYSLGAEGDFEAAAAGERADESSAADESWDRGGEAPPSEPVFERPPPPPPPPPPARVQLALPPVSELAKCVMLLVGGDVSVKTAEVPSSVNRTTRDCYAASILDDSDQTVGMILMDLRAAAFLGGTLMMLPRAEIEQQLLAFSPGEDSIAAAAEICNALAGAINGSQDQHVRIGRLEKFEFKTWSWVTNAAERRDMEDNFGGRTVLFSRSPPLQII